MDPATVQGLHGALGSTWVIVLNETIVEALCLSMRVSSIALLTVYSDLRHTFLSGMILTLWT